MSAAVAVDAPKQWGPQEGPQRAFAECEADIAIFGGSAGGGKSFALLYECVKWVMLATVRAYRAVLFRRTNPELIGGGGLWDESQELYRAFGGRPRGAPALDWTFEAPTRKIAHRHRIEFRHLQRDSTVHEHQGRQYAFIGFDELTHFTEAQFWYMVSRLRSQCGVRPYLRATCNPDPDHFVKDLIAWWLDDEGYPDLAKSGVIRWFVRVDDALQWFDSREAAVAEHPDSEPLSFTFIASRLADNKILAANDKGYKGRLMALTRVQRERLLGDAKRGGNWFVTEGEGEFFNKSDFQESDGPPSPVVFTCRGWDKAASRPSAQYPDPDWTRGVRVSLCRDGELWIDDAEEMRDTPPAVMRLQRATAERDTRAVVQAIYRDTGDAGASDAHTTARGLEGFQVHEVESWQADSSKEKGDFRSSRAKRARARIWMKRVEDHRVFIKRGVPWAGSLKSEAHRFPKGRHDDWIDAISCAIMAIDEIGSGAIGSASLDGQSEAEAIAGLI